MRIDGKNSHKCKETSFYHVATGGLDCAAQARDMNEQSGLIFDHLLLDKDRQYV